MQANFFLRIENLLWLVPATAGYLFAIALPESYCSVMLFDNQFLISHLEATFSWIIILLFPYLMHYALRTQNKRNRTIEAIHIISTLAIVIGFPFLYNSAPLILDQWHHLTVPPPMYERWQNIGNIADIMWIIFVLIQVSFFTYGFFVLFKKDKNIAAT